MPADASSDKVDQSFKQLSWEELRDLLYFAIQFLGEPGKQSSWISQVLL